MNNRSIARQLRAMSTLLEADGQEAWRLAAYRKAAEAIRAWPDEIADNLAALDNIRGVAKDVREVVRSLVKDGASAAYKELPLQVVPHGLREVLDLPGVGSKTARELFDRFGIGSATDLDLALALRSAELAAKIGSSALARLRVESGRRHRRLQRVPLQTAIAVGNRALVLLRGLDEVKRAELTGEVRRMKPTVTSVACLAAVEGSDRAALRARLTAMEGCVSASEDADETLGGVTTAVFEQVVDDRRILVTVYVAAWQRFFEAWVLTSGDESHRGLLSTERTDGQVVNGTAPNATPADAAALTWTAEERADRLAEEAVYRRRGWPYVMAELREGTSLEAQAFGLEALSARQIRGDLHMHTHASDGSHSLEDMVAACIRRGYAFMAVTDHSRSLRVANGLSVERLWRQREEVLRLRAKYPEIVIWHGAEVDILADATLDFPDDVLAELDVVVASIHVSMHQPVEELTARILHAIQSPHVDIIGHPTGRLLSRRDSYPLDFARVFEAAARNRVALEINANPDRLDLDPERARVAREVGCTFAVDSDAHSRDDLERLPAFGVSMARRAWLEPQQVINSWDVGRLAAWLRGETGRDDGLTGG